MGQHIRDFHLAQRIMTTTVRSRLILSCDSKQHPLDLRLILLSLIHDPELSRHYFHQVTLVDDCYCHGPLPLVTDSTISITMLFAPLLAHSLAPLPKTASVAMLMTACRTSPPFCRHWPSFITIRFCTRAGKIPSPPLLPFSQLARVGHITATNNHQVNIRDERIICRDPYFILFFNIFFGFYQSFRLCEGSNFQMLFKKTEKKG